MVIALLLLVGGCVALGATVLNSFTGHLGTGQRIARLSGGRIDFALVIDSPAGAVVSVVFADGMTRSSAERLTCQLVIPELSRDGVRPFQIQLTLSDGTSVIWRAPIDDCGPGFPTPQLPST